MPPSAPDAAELQVAGQTLAVIAELLYLVNLLLLPVIAFSVLVALYLRHIKTAPALAVCHLRQTLAGSLWAGLLLVIANGIIIGLGGFASSWTWLVVIIYFTVCHASLVLVGTVGLAKAMAGKPYRYPLIGRPCHAE